MTHTMTEVSLADIISHDKYTNMNATTATSLLNLIKNLATEVKLLREENVILRNNNNNINTASANAWKGFTSNNGVRTEIINL